MGSLVDSRQDLQPGLPAFFDRKKPLKMEKVIHRMVNNLMKEQKHQQKNQPMHLNLMLIRLVKKDV